VTDLVIRHADLGAGRRADVRISGERIVAVSPELAVGATDRMLDAAGGGVIPGLHDHHVHLYAWSAARRSLFVGPPVTRDDRAFAAVLADADRSLAPGAWLRGVGYDESVAGRLDRHVLDARVAQRPVRIQHRSGIEWVVNSAALDLLPPALLHDPGVERGPSGEATGRLTRMDDRLAQAWTPAEIDLAELSALALQHGITGFTDATPIQDQSGTDRLVTAIERREVVQRVTVMGAPGARLAGCRVIRVVAVKVVLDDVTLPTFEELRALVVDAHRRGRPVAVHCVTGVQTVLTMSVFSDAGTVPGDRIEHGALIAPELIPELSRLGITVITNPGFVHDRGDAYLAEVDSCDQRDLYRCASLRRGGVDVAAGTDAPFGPADPWQVVRAATTRKTKGGVLLGPQEALSPCDALSLFFGSGDAPGRPRRVLPGGLADLVVLRSPLSEALESLSGENVALCMIAGRVVLDRR
jgi:predicted amidohydrolase YtcJ